MMLGSILIPGNKPGVLSSFIICFYNQLGLVIMYVGLTLCNIKKLLVYTIQVINVFCAF